MRLAALTISALERLDAILEAARPRPGFGATSPPMTSASNTCTMKPSGSSCTSGTSARIRTRDEVWVARARGPDRPASRGSRGSGWGLGSGPRQGTASASRREFVRRAVRTRPEGRRRRRRPAGAAPPPRSRPDRSPTVRQGCGTRRRGPKWLRGESGPFKGRRLGRLAVVALARSRPRAGRSAMVWAAYSTHTLSDRFW